MTEPEEPRSEPTGGDEEQPSALRTFLGLFLVPLLVVLACVAVFIGFGWIAYDRQSTSDYLNDLHSSWKPRRAQAAYELSKILTADPTALDEEPDGDTITVKGHPDLTVKLQGTNGDLATVAMAVNAIKRTKEGAPGLVTMRDLPIVTIF